MARRSWSVRFLRPGQGIVWRRSARNGAAMQPALTALAFQYPEKLPSRCTRFRGRGQNHLAFTLWRQARLTGEAEPPRQTVARSGTLRPGYANSESPNLIFLIVSVVASRTHRVSGHVISHCSAQPICAHAAGSEMNAAKDAGIDDFRCRLREIRIRTSARTYLRGDAKRCILSKRGAKDESRCSTHRGMSRGILRMRRSTRQRIQPRLPQRLGIRRRETRSDRRDRPPENVAVLAIPARDKRIGKREIQ